jgi:hypothetical protein
MTQATNKALEKLPQHLPVLYSYMDSTLALEDTLRTRMLKMTSRQFERVLHPIFEQDELTLILAGAVLGFAAGLVQQGLETGQIKLPNLPNFLVNLKTRIRAKIQKKPPSSKNEETPSSTKDQWENNSSESEDDDDDEPTSNEDAKKDDDDDDKPV